VARRFPFQTSFAAGELAEEYMMRTDIQARNEGARRFRNAMNAAGGGFRRRWGTLDVAALPGLTRVETYGIGEADARLLAFTSGAVRILGLDGAVQQTVTDCPWTEANLFVMQVAIEDGKIVVCSDAFAPQILTLSGGTWSIATLAFAEGLNGARLQPYWRFHERGVSLTVGAYSGTGVSLSTSDDFFTAAHVGSRIRYTGIEIQVASVTNATTATGDIIGTLYPTLTVGVGATAGFVVGQVVQGKDTQIRGVVAAVSSSLTIQLLDGYTAFDAAEKLVGPTAETTISSIATASTPAATTDWDEALISPARGYPKACALHRNRLMLGGFPQAENVMAASAIGDITDFNPGTGLETDAIIERVGRETSLGLRHFGSTEQLILLTEAGVQYVPEQVGAPLSPTNYELLKIGPEAAASPQPLLVSEGLAFIEQGSGRCMICIPTGNVRRSWEIGDLSELAFHLMGSPRELELLAANTETDRLVMALKDDGDIAVLTFRRNAQFSAWGLWQTPGAWRSLVVAAGTLYAVAERVIAGSTVYRLEKFDPSAWADGMVQIAARTAPVPLYASGVAGAWEGSAKIGEFTLDGSGVLQGVDDSYEGALRVGLDFTLEVETVPPVDQQMGLRPNYKITRVDCDVIESVGFKGNGTDPSGWTGGIGGPVQPTTGVRRFRPLGRAKYPTFTIRQEVGGPLEVRSLTMEVTS
jgi:hypothetical protein